MVIKHGTGDYFFVLCWNATILSFPFILTKPQIKGNFSLSRSSLAPVSFQSAYDPFKSLMCNVSNHVVFSSSMLCFTKRKKGKDLVDYVKNKYGEENVLKEICPKCSKKFKCFSARIYENESGMMQCYAHFYICKLEYIRIWPCSAITKCYFRTILAICFTLISLHLRHQ